MRAPARAASAAAATLFALAGCGVRAPEEAAPPAPGPAAGPRVVKVGLERLAEARVADRHPDDGAAGAGEGPRGVSFVEHLSGKRLGLVVHAASVTADGRHAIDVLAGHGLEVARLFAPEHGLRGRAAAGEKVEDGRDPRSGLPVVSLYGETRQPRAADLADLDAVVFDLQGAGVRFYTYVSTLILTLEAAAENGVELVVLDRPNPLGGRRIEGPPSAPRDVVPESFVNLAPGPLVHGLTLGEMSRVVNAGRARPARLSVVEMAGWERDMTWADTGRPWVSPSPNLRSPEAAIAYPGVALLEATNVSEGRGTEQPFLYLGAPWLAGAGLELEVAGFALEPARFTPRASPAAPWAKHLDEECFGWRVRVTDPAAARPYRLGVSLLTELSRREGFEWRRGGEALTWLVGNPALHEALVRGVAVEEIVARDQDAHDAWRRLIGGHLLYPATGSATGAARVRRR